MIDYSLHCRIQELDAQGFSVARIAALTGLNEKTVTRWRGCAYRAREGSNRRASKLDPFKARIGQWLGQADFTVAQIYQKLRKDGYDGGRSIVGDYLRLIRPKTRPAFRTLHYEPGEAAQIDWGNYGSLRIGSTRRRLSFLCVVLCHSRLLYVEAFVQERIEHVLGGLAGALDYFGGTPRELIVDNMKTAVIEHRPGTPPKFNARFHDFCSHFGASPHACTPRRANEKGRVESAVAYIKGNFFNGFDFDQLPADRPLESLNQRLRLWMEDTANVRQHRETRQRPRDLFENTERAALIPLNANPCDTGALVTVRVTNRCRVHCDSNRYSVPPSHSQRQVQLHRFHDRLCLYHQGALIARHPRSYDRHQQIVDPDHQSALILEQSRGRHAADLLAFESLCPVMAPLWLANLQQRHPGSSLIHVRQILRLADLYGIPAIASALEASRRHELYTWQTIRHLVEMRQRTSRQPDPAPMAPSAASRDLLNIHLPTPDLNHYPGNPASN